MRCCDWKGDIPTNSQQPALPKDEPKSHNPMSLSPARVPGSHDERDPPALSVPEEVHRWPSVLSPDPHQYQDPNYLKPHRYENSSPGIRRPPLSVQSDSSTHFPEDFSAPRSPDSVHRMNSTRSSMPPSAYSPPTIVKNRPPSIADSVDTRAEPNLPDLAPAQARMCVAIDFGTVLSGVACGISTNPVRQILWPGSYRKIPTCLVYDSTGRVVAWGQEAKTITLQKGWIRCEM